MPADSFRRRITQALLLSAVLPLAFQARAATVVVSRVVRPVVVSRPAPVVVVNRVVSPPVHYGWADVLRVSPVYATAGVERHHQECVDEPVVVQEGHRPGSGLLGAVVGGVLGSTVGKGDGRTAATVVGAVAGAAVGNAAGRRSAYETTATNCHDVVTVGEPEILGYDVEYRYHGDVYASRLSYDPGARMRVRIDVSPEG
ncbi:glycine zipper 2TM domain-containing protein [Frateuria sp. YIM B11624]|uniref:glycine zipper 2TM domain-containing protein n=1 Tax=Frateuria sp. YIM B11624 TaxID=3143185 RepID=UPI003C791146